MVVIGILLFIFAPQIVTIFTNTKEVQIMVVNVLRLIALFQCFIAITQIFTSALQGAGDTKFPMYATLIGIWGVRVGIGYFLGVIMNMGLFGVWIAYALDITVRAFLLMIRFNHGKWKSITILLIEDFTAETCIKTSLQSLPSSTILLTDSKCPIALDSLLII